MTLLAISIAFFVGFLFGMLALIPFVNRIIASQAEEHVTNRKLTDLLNETRAAVGELLELTDSWRRRAEHWKSICENKYGWKLRGANLAQVKLGEQDAAAQEEQR